MDKLINNCLGRIELCATLTSITKLEYNQVNGTVLVFTIGFDKFFSSHFNEKNHDVTEHLKLRIMAIFLTFLLGNTKYEKYQLKRFQSDRKRPTWKKKKKLSMKSLR